MRTKYKLQSYKKVEKCNMNRSRNDNMHLPHIVIAFLILYISVTEPQTEAICKLSSAQTNAKTKNCTDKLLTETDV